MRHTIFVLILLFCGCTAEFWQDQRITDRYNLLAQHPEWNSETRSDVLAGIVRMGMTQDMVLVSWGQPHDVNRTVGSWGTHEQWVYGYRQQYDYTRSETYFVPSTYFYFENGILTSYQD